MRLTQKAAFAIALSTLTGAIFPTTSMAAPYTTNQAPDRYEMDRAEYLAGYAYAVRYCNTHHIDIGKVPDAVFSARDQRTKQLYGGKATPTRIFVSGFNQALRDMGFEGPIS
jgi:hypothetical protein